MKDVNGTGFDLVLGRTDWSAWRGVQWAGESEAHPMVYDERRERVTLRQRVESLQLNGSQSTNATLRDEQRSSAARDRYGNWYWIDPEDRGTIRVRNSGDGTIEPFWPPSPHSPDSRTTEPTNRPESPFRPKSRPNGRTEQKRRFGALTITEDHRLVVGISAPEDGGSAPGLLIFDLHGGGGPRPISLPAPSAFTPINMAPRANGGCYVLDDSTSDGDRLGRIWVFDSDFQIQGPVRSAHEEDVFESVGEDEQTDSSGNRAPVDRGPFMIPTDHANVPAHAILSLPDDTVFVLFAGRRNPAHEEARDVSTLNRYEFRADAPAADSLSMRGSVALDVRLEDLDISGPDPTVKGWKAHDVVYIEAPAGPTQSFAGTLYTVGGRGNQAFAFDVWGDERDLEVEIRTEEIPLRRFQGKALVAAGNDVYYDFRDRWLPLVPRPRQRFVANGQIVSEPFDSDRRACTWHRLFLDGCIPPGTSVRVESRAADRLDRLEDQPWDREPELYHRDTGSELPYVSSTEEREGGTNGEGTWELLFQQAEGRYLQLRLTVESDGRRAPSVHALRVYRPRFSYLDEYFPDVYRQDEDSAHFFERYLANVEGTFTALEGQIAHVERLFDTRTVPDEYLDWLGSWFDTEFDPALDARRKRLFLNHAVELYNQRGTPRGLARMLSLALDHCVDESVFTADGVAAAIGRPEDAGDRATRHFGVRIVEEYATRDVPRVRLGDSTVPEQPTEVRVDTPWTPSDGKDTLDHRFAQFLGRRYSQESGRDRSDLWPEPIRFPPLIPSSSDDNGSRKRDDWRTFTRRFIDGPYAEIERDSVITSPGSSADPVTRRYRRFLRRRYRRIASLADEWSDAPDAFDRALIPQGEFPTGQALVDWMDFVGLVLPIDRSAHRFRVLVPVEPEEDVSTQRERLNVARRVVDREKPAHTAVDVLPYWAAFQVGTGRTGLDTILGAGRRYSDLLVGSDALGETTVGGAHPSNVSDRRVAGRDSTDARTPL